MNHAKHYNCLIEKARSRPKPKGYVERHHIIPRSLGGSNAPENLVYLTAQEHFIAHKLLAHIHGGKMIVAMILMSGGKRYGGRVYKWMREEYAKINGSWHTEESRRKISASNMGRIHSKEHSDKIRAARNTPEAKARVKEVHTGKIVRPETRKKLANAQGVPVIQLNLDGEFIAEFPSMLEAAKSIGSSRMVITRAANNERKLRGNIVKNFRWKLKNET